MWGRADWLRLARKMGNGQVEMRLHCNRSLGNRMGGSLIGLLRCRVRAQTGRDAELPCLALHAQAKECCCGQQVGIAETDRLGYTDRIELDPFEHRPTVKAVVESAPVYQAGEAVRVGPAGNRLRKLAVRSADRTDIEITEAQLDELLGEFAPKRLASRERHGGLASVGRAGRERLRQIACESSRPARCQPRAARRHWRPP